MQRLRKIEVQPTTLCNNRCGYCVGAGLFPKRTTSLSKEAFSSIAREVSVSSIPLIVISGMMGEPLLNRETAGFIRQLKAGPSEKQHIGLYTNGTALTKEAREALVSDNRIGDYINIHLSAHPWVSFRQYHEIHGANPFFQGTKVLRNINALTELRAKRNSMLYIRINFLATAHNSGDLKKLRESLESLKNFGVDAIRVSIPIETGFSPIREGYFLNDEQIAMLKQYTDKSAKSGSKVIVVPERLIKVDWNKYKNPFSRCYVKETALAVSPDGHAAPCCWTTFPGYPHRGGLVSEGIAKLIDQIRRMKFDPRDICPPCSRTDYEYNLRKTRESKSVK